MLYRRELMPPKPKPKAPAGKPAEAAAEAKAGAAPVDEYDTMNLEQLQDALHKSMTKFNELRRNRNFFQLERVRIFKTDS